uniref:Uncharacterized protein n=1 Tax=Sphaerodactylus townsendi TaxID=933632 RepID=A0ACB8ECJ3_9SAUR
MFVHINYSAICMTTMERKPTRMPCYTHTLSSHTFGLILYLYLTPLKRQNVLVKKSEIFKLLFSDVCVTIQISLSYLKFFFFKKNITSGGRGRIQLPNIESMRGTEVCNWAVWDKQT